MTQSQNNHPRGEDGRLLIGKKRYCVSCKTFSAKVVRQDKDGHPELKCECGHTMQCRYVDKLGE